MQDKEIRKRNSLPGNKTRLFNFFGKFDRQIKERSERIEGLEKNQNELGKQLKYASKITDRIQTLERELADLFQRISVKA